MCKAKDKNIINLKAGQSKLDGQEKARIHAMKQECHDKNEKILRCFFMGSLDSGRGTEATDSQIPSIRSESSQACYTVPSGTCRRKHGKSAKRKHEKPPVNYILQQCPLPKKQDQKLYNFTK